MPNWRISGALAAADVRAALGVNEQAAGPDAWAFTGAPGPALAAALGETTLPDGSRLIGAENPDLAAALAAEIRVNPAVAGQRLEALIAAAAARMRAQTDPLPPDGGLLPPPDPGNVTLIRRRQPYAGFFTVEEHRLTHLRHDGAPTPPIDRSVFLSGDAVVVLPWDVARDRVMVIDQFRAAPAARGDHQPWLVETIAGRIDGVDNPEDTARREALEEAGLTLGRLVAGPNCYPSPGAVGEYLYTFIGAADLPDDAAGLGGLESEAEDIRTHILPRAELTRMALDGVIRNGPLVMLALWLECSQTRVRAALAG
ncbi:NUDIX domain-containing protein [Paracoccus pacificus]|uniref:ADP-ribose pyrophosphatase n=1 Tax=Paracoccus pacificus TaxID=1463598 RepID=A0ABW4RC45_9RHOB